MQQPVVEYTIDSKDALASVNAEWDEFARENDGGAVMADRVLGRPIWDFIEGAKTVLFYRMVFLGCRETGVTTRFDFRCDSPGVRRVLCMEIIPGANGALTFRNEILSISDMSADPRVLSFRQYADRNRCAICGSIKIGEEWIDIFDFSERRIEVGGYDICESCRQKARRQGPATLLEFPKK
ncbi:hypothetical protein [Shimia sp.]|uniref:hypothetical protein n=1 Tax=Shimia sp. TaxID=1954381 RepID=UPI0035650A17